MAVKTKKPHDVTGYGVAVDAPLFQVAGSVSEPKQSSPLPTSTEVSARVSDSRRWKILQFIYNVENATLHELCEAFNVTPNQISGRISDLKRDLLLEETGQYRPSHSGCASMVYQLTTHGRDHILKSQTSRSA